MRGGERRGGAQGTDSIVSQDDGSCAAGGARICVARSRGDTKVDQVQRGDVRQQSSLMSACVGGGMNAKAGGRTFPRVVLACG